MTSWGWHFEWLTSTKMLVTLGVLAAWWAVALWLGARIGRFMADRPPVLRRVCAWCGLVMAEGDPGAATSHGICQPCAKKATARISLAGGQCVVWPTTGTGKDVASCHRS